MGKVRRALDNLLAGMRSLPNRIRQYDAYAFLYDTLKNYTIGHGIMSNMKTEALIGRHWKTILQRLGIHMAFSEVTIDLLWDRGARRECSKTLSNPKILGKDVMGDTTLEIFVRDVAGNIFCFDY